jgi:hypothetical protein
MIPSTLRCASQRHANPRFATQRHFQKKTTIETFGASRVLARRRISPRLSAMQRNGITREVL